MSRTMRAAVIHRFGGPEVLRAESVPEPVAGEGESVIDVRLAGLNYADLEIRAGTYDPPPLPAVLGADVVGRRRSDGRRVAALLRHGGGYAQVAVARDEHTVEVPEDVTDAQALCLLEQGCTAHSALATVGRLRAGESVAVSSAAGGVGHLAVQLARAAGASTVVGLASTPAKRDFVRSLGADHAVGLPEEVREAVPGGVDLYVDSLGGPYLPAALAALAPFGRVVSVGWRAEAPAPVALGDLIERSVGLHGVWMRHVLLAPGLLARTADHLFALARKGLLTGHVDRVVPLAEVGRAHAAVAARQTAGKVLVDVHG
ncbi:zinc-binding dehydrogenase [Streptomyces sp. B1866]|uniref:quinone oxidoreductase family protein n=1 Tax=Streptomyces sp. B1866 TaxID=3075431 RepID=UPI0028909C5E|nr:zinc-binding dehydrogenase [Streptomyces sp. B1866]MDT3399249.1 zinc-binding dehydrogenase [Streptomyces sp. B1866]